MLFFFPIMPFKFRHMPLMRSVVLERVYTGADFLVVKERQEDTSRVRRDYQPKEERLFVDVVPQAAGRVGALYYR